jgi:hypothetical protein
MFGTKRGVVGAGRKVSLATVSRKIPVGGKQNPRRRRQGCRHEARTRWEEKKVCAPKWRNNTRRLQYTLLSTIILTCRFRRTIKKTNPATRHQQRSSKSSPIGRRHTAYKTLRISHLTLPYFLDYLEIYQPPCHTRVGFEYRLHGPSEW